MEKKELWHDMLTTYCRLMHYENGITVPNMIGAYYLYDSSIDLSSSRCVIRVLSEMIASKNNVNVLIQRCGRINNYVLSLLEEKHPKLGNLNNKIFIGMYDNYCLKKHLSSVDELGEYLYSVHREEIIDKRFSITDGVWNPLSDVEKGYINDIIKTL